MVYTNAKGVIMQLDLFVLEEQYDILEGEEFQTCKVCHLEKPLDRFYQQGRHTKATICKACANEGRAWRKRERKKYEHLDTGSCHCCGRKSNILHFDHDHNTKKYRGWLCLHCNQGIGKLGDDLKGVENALKYLRNKKGA